MAFCFRCRSTGECAVDRPCFSATSTHHRPKAGASSLHAAMCSNCCGQLNPSRHNSIGNPKGKSIPHNVFRDAAINSTRCCNADARSAVPARSSSRARRLNCNWPSLVALRASAQASQIFFPANLAPLKSTPTTVSIFTRFPRPRSFLRSRLSEVNRSNHPPAFLNSCGEPVAVMRPFSMTYT